MNNITLVGTLGKDAEQVVAASGNKRTRIRLAVTEQGGTENEKTHWVDVTAFGTLGENAAVSLKKGQRVVVMGRLDTYDREVQINGEDKTIGQVAFVASAIGPDLRWATAEVTKVQGNSGGGQQSRPAPAKEAAPAAPAPAGDEEDF